MDDEGGREDARLLALRDLVYLHVEPPALAPPQVHAQEHLGPVLGVGPALAGVDLAHGVAFVVLAREERAQLEVVQRLAQGGHRLLQLGRHRLVLLLESQLVERLRVGQALPQLLKGADVVAHPAVLRGDAPRPLRVVPQVGTGYLGLQLGQAGAAPGQVQVHLGLREAFAQRGQVLAEFAHSEDLRRGDPVERPG